MSRFTRHARMLAAVVFASAVLTGLPPSADAGSPAAAAVAPAHVAAKILPASSRATHLRPLGGPPVIKSLAGEQGEANRALVDPNNATISGHVDFSGSGWDPNAANSVSVWKLDVSGPSDAYKSANISSSGNFTVTGLPAGTYTLDFNFLFYDAECGCNLANDQWWGQGISSRTAEYFAVGMSENYALGTSYQIIDDAPIEGRMVSGSGNPLAGFAVAYDAAHTAPRTSNLVWWSAIRPDGTYTMPHMTVGTYRIGFVAGPAPYVLSNGALGPSSPFVSEWYYDVATYAEAVDLTLTDSGLSAVDGVMGFGWSSTPGVAPWDGELVGATNPAENNCGCGHGDPVSSATGEFYDAMTDLELPGVGPLLAITRNYSSAKADDDRAFGYGFSTLIDSRVNVIEAGTGWQPDLVEVVQENGSTVRFALDGGGYVPLSDRARAELSYDGNEWTFVRRANDTFVFSESGAFLSLTDRNGNSMFADYYSGELVSLYMSDGRELFLTWSGDHVTEVEDSAGRVIEYDYSGSELVEVTGLDGHETTYGYDSSHRMTTVTRPGSATLTSVYDGSGRVIEQTDQVGRVTTFAYAAGTTTITLPSGSQTVDRYDSGLLVSQTIGAGTPAAATTYFYYDGNNDMVQVVDPMGKITINTFDSNGNVVVEKDATRTAYRTFDSRSNPTSFTDPLGRLTTLSYDTDGNLLSITDPANQTRSWTYNVDGTMATSVDPGGKVTTYTYDDAGRLLETEDPLGHTTAVTYDDAGHILSSTDALGKVTEFTVDEAGQVLTREDPNGHVTTFTYDGRGNQTTVVDAEAKTTTMTYNAADEVTAVTDALNKTTTYTYTLDGYPETVTDPLSRVTTTTYDVRGNPLTVTDPAGHTKSFTYDRRGNLLTTTLPSGAVTTLAYDSTGFGLVMSSTNPLGKTTTFGYYADGSLAEVTDPLSRTTYTSYFLDGRVKAVDYPNSSFESYLYDSRGNLTQFTNADGDVTSYAYDDASRTTSKTEPGSLLTQYGYDAADRLTSTTRPNGTSVTYTYDDAGQLTTAHESTAGTVDVTFTYDDVGRRLTMTDVTGTTTYTYSGRGQVLSATNGAGSSLGFGYDDAGQRTSVVYPGSQTVAYTYDLAGNLDTVTDWNSKTTTYTWTVDDLLSTQTGPNGIVETRLYDLAAQLLSITDKKGSTQVAKYSYTYDNAGQLITDLTADPIAASVAHTYTYDAVSQLKSSKTGSAAAKPYTATPGNKITKTANGDVYTYNTLQQLTKVQPTSGAATNFTYNGNGARLTSTTSSSVTTYTYTPSGSLASAVVPGASGGTVTYKTDGDGLRQSRTKSSATANFLWDTVSDIPLMLADGGQWYIYGATTTPIAQIEKLGGTTTYLHADLIGSVRLLTTATGTTAGANTFDPFGKRTAHTGASDSAFGFTGAWTDITTTLVYLRARDYDPRSSQFMVVDPAVEKTRDPYAYVSNNPLLMVDPLGLCASGLSAWDCFSSDYGNPGHNLANIAFGIGDTFTISPIAWFFGYGSLTEWLRDATGTNCVIKGNGFHTFGSIWAGFAGGAISGPAGVGLAATGGKSGAIAANTPAFTRFTVNSAGETILNLRLGSGSVQVTEHAALRMAERNISIELAEAALSQSPFRYFHDDIWKIGYYDSTSRVFVGTVNGEVTTIISNATSNYISNLQAVLP